MGYIELILSILVILVLWNFYNKREDEEKYIGWKIVGYYLLGIFTFSFNSFPIPLGFAIFIFFFKPALNKKVKSYAAYTGLAMFLLSNIIPFTQDMIYEYPRKVEVIGAKSIYQFEFQENWENMKEEFDINFAIINNLALEYKKEGQIESMRVEAEDHSNGSERIYYILKWDGSNEFEVRRHRSKYEQPPHWEQQQEQSTVNNFFRMLDEADFTKLRPSPHSERFEMRAHEMSKMYYAVKENDKYAVWGDQVVEITNEQLPVYGYHIDICGNSGAEKGCTEYANYLFDAELNARDDEHE